MVQAEIPQERLDKFFSMTERALKKVRIAKEKRIEWQTVAKDFLQMAQHYFEDAKHFRQKGDVVTAFAAVSYAHAWLDAGARLGLFDVGKDSELFATD